MRVMALPITFLSDYGLRDEFGGVAEAVEVSASPWRLEPVSATFHGRDVFAPAAELLGVRACDELRVKRG